MLANFKIRCDFMGKTAVACLLENLLEDDNFYSNPLTNPDDPYIHLKKDVKLCLSRKDFERCKAFIKSLDESNLI